MENVIKILLEIVEIKVTVACLQGNVPSLFTVRKKIDRLESNRDTRRILLPCPYNALERKQQAGLYSS